MPSADPLTVVIVGAGPRGTGVLERLLVNVGELMPDQELHVHLVDPYPPGAGRVWREDQSSLMWMNATAENVTMFPDDTCLLDGPLRTGPSLAEWAATHETGCDPAAFASRNTQGRYLAWVLDKIVAEAPERVTVTVHATTAVRLERLDNGRERLRLAKGGVLYPDAVVLALGHLEVEPDKQERALSDFAARHGLHYVPPAYTVDVDWSDLAPGEPVLVRGLGLAFIDLMALLTEGRGGRYETTENGLAYVKSGQEPVLYVGSRRGVPYRAKMSYRLSGAPAPLPWFFDGNTVDNRFTFQQDLDFYAHLWPSMAKEVGWGHYHELFRSHPDRVTVAWPDFAEVYTALDWGGPEMRRLIETSVPDPEDRLDFDGLDGPLSGLAFEDFEQLQKHLAEHIEADVTRRGDAAHSADLGAFQALWSVHGEMSAVLAGGKLTARSQVEDLSGWWSGFFDYVGSGPPGERLEQLLALANAGIVRFLGAGTWVTADERRGVFRGGGYNSEHTVEAKTLVEARLPRSTLRNCSDPLLRGLYEDGAAMEHQVSDEDGFEHSSGVLHVSPHDFRILDRAGEPQDGRYALGPYTNVSHFATFARPRVNALSFRQNDTLARGLLGHLLGIDHGKRQDQKATETIQPRLAA
ncbi:FAD/NAD(P)-binding protein [Amycolatopsis sp. cg5]|uniref:FAD/NAD(P)-binding protein n=1 Tax=Amycolatopsis sp. cg5 TaxID=3238802 RepID=UPI00352314E9